MFNISIFSLMFLQVHQGKPKSGNSRVKMLFLTKKGEATFVSTYRQFLNIESRESGILL